MLVHPSNRAPTASPRVPLVARSAWLASAHVARSAWLAPTPVARSARLASAPVARPARLASTLALALAVFACGGDGDPAPPAAGGDPVGDPVIDLQHPQDAFLAHLASMCGQAFRGEATLASGPGFEEGLIMHVRRCEDDEVQIPLHTGENRSRTWIITRTADGLRLKHDHRLEDGSDDPVTQYGGDTAEPGTATRQSFPADAFTAELLPEAATNIWTITLTPGESLVYHLTRHGEPRATFEFDLNDAVEPPPAPWGYEGT